MGRGKANILHNEVRSHRIDSSDTIVVGGARACGCSVASAPMSSAGQGAGFTCLREGPSSQQRVAHSSCAMS
jgi:hypothetical protein